MNQFYKCTKCGKSLEEWETYEYRGVYSCEECFDDVCGNRDKEREEIIKEEDNKTKVFKGLDLSDSIIGKANKDILKRNIEISSKESTKLYNYEHTQNKRGLNDR